MIPRASIIAVQQNYSFKQINDIINKESHSRMPVYRKDLDDILGMVHIKDIIKFSGPQSSNFDVKKNFKRNFICSTYNASNESFTKNASNKITYGTGY